MAQPETFLNIFKNFRAVHVVSLLCGITSRVACSCFSCQIQIYWSARRMEFELDEGHWLFPIFDFTGRSFGIGRWTFLSNGPIKPKIKIFRIWKVFTSFLLFPNQAPLPLPAHWWWDSMWKMWQMVGQPTWKYYFLRTPHLLLASMGDPIWSALTKLAIQNLLFTSSLKCLQLHPKENEDKFCQNMEYLLLNIIGKYRW